MNGQLRRGLAEARDGFTILKDSGIEPGFVVQKRRVLGLCHLACLRVGSARALLALAYHEALAICAFDQIRWYTRLAAALSTLRTSFKVR